MVGMPEASDAQIVERLTSLGMEPWLAEHLVQWLPLAAILQRSKTVQFETAFTVAGTSSSFDDAPIFLTARAVLSRWSQANIEFVASRAKLLCDIERLLREADAKGEPHNASDPLIVSISLAHTPPPIEPGDGGVPRVNEGFQGHIADHGFKALPEGMSMHASVYPTITASHFSIYIDLVVRDPRTTTGVVVETVLGNGHTIRDAVIQATSKLELNVMHVFFASLVDHRSCADQVFWEDWQHQLGRLRVCHGGELHFYNPESVPSFAPLLTELRAALAEEPLANGFHALRVFTARRGAEALGEEVLLNGEFWPRGMEVLRAHAWPHVEVPWGVRFFAMMEASADVN